MCPACSARPGRPCSARARRRGPRGPGRQPGQGRGGRPDEVVVLGRPVEGALRRGRWWPPGRRAMLSASAARYISMAAGTARARRGRRRPARRRAARAAARCRPAARLDAGELVAGHQPADQADGEDRAVADDVVGEGVGPARGSRPRAALRRSAGMASSIRSAARSTSPAARACRTASRASSGLLRTTRWRAGAAPATWSGCSPSRCARRTSANRWW